MFHKYVIKYSACICIALLLQDAAVLAQSRSSKRGICWDERNQHLNTEAVAKMSDGIAWTYNWAITPAEEVEHLGNAEGLNFAPMCWNANYDETKLRAFLNSHPEVKYLLGFNEPNFKAQANMTPQAAASAWPSLESLAAEFDLMLVAPALNFTSEQVGGRTWSPYEWLDEFIRRYKQNNNSRLPRLDCLALHCYMNWYGAFTWFATEYFYSDLYDASKKDVYGKYPHIVELLDAAMQATGHFPRMMLTEFCAYEGNKDGFVTSTDSQIDQMIQKVQKLEQSDLVEGYAWFMANPDGGAIAYPYNSLFVTNQRGSELSELGKVYVNMSSFDTDRYYASGEPVLAKDYVDASGDEQQPIVRSDTETVSDAMLKVRMQPGTWTKYLIDVAETGSQQFSIHISAQSDCNVWLYVDGHAVTKKTVSATGSGWEDRELSASVDAGRHEVMIYNAGSTPFDFNRFEFAGPGSGVSNVLSEPAMKKIYNLAGIFLGEAESISELGLERGVYLVVTEGKTTKVAVR